jgi:hypothetical protein
MAATGPAPAPSREAGAAAASSGATEGGGAAGGGGGGGGGGPSARDPHSDPRFQAMKGRTAGVAAGERAHVPAAAGAAAAQGAAAPPANEVASQAAGAQVDEMGQQQPGVFNRAAFIAAVKKAVDAASPQNLEEADDFKGSGKAGKVKDQVVGIVKGGKEDSAKAIKTATDAAPDRSKATPKPVTPMPPMQAGPAPAGVAAGSAMPQARPPEETDLSAGPKRVDDQMAEAGVTEEQIQKSNEPDFTGALKARDDARTHSETAPAGYRAQEDQVLTKSQEEAAGVAATGVAGMRGTKVAALAKAMGHQGAAKSADETKRAKVAADIDQIYVTTKTDVDKILTELDGKVETAFTQGEEIARKQFETFVGDKMDAYKDDRYSGWTGGLKWAKDKLFGMPSAVNVFYEQGKAGYLKAMDVVIGQVADIVGRELTAARDRIAKGRADVTKYVAELPKELQKVGKDAEGKLDSQFDQLSSDVDNKEGELVDSLAQKYVAAQSSLDERIEELKAANKGLVDKAIDAVVGVVKTILKLKDMLLGVLAKAASVIGDIISDPIGFLGNLVEGIRSGVVKFKDNIVKHLEKGLMDWLFGAMGNAGIKLPEKLDLAGILDLAMQILGLTYENIRSRVVKLVGEENVARMEKTVDVFKTLVTKGVGGLWEWIKDKISNLEDMVLGAIKDFVIERVVKAGITWIISLLNPAAAFIKACKAIYDIVMWIVERGAQIMEFVNSVLDAIGDIAKGNLGAVASKVEDSLAKALPVAISFLASLLGLGGISEKIKSIIDTVRAPINKAVDWVVGGAVKGFKKVFGGAAKWAKGKYEKGKAFVKGKVEAGKKWVKGKVEAGKTWVKGKAGAAKAFVKEKAGDILGWIKEKLGIIKAQEGFEMEGEGHTLTALGEDDELDVTMASGVATSLGPMVDDAITAVGKSRDPNKDKTLKILREIAAALAKAKAGWRGQVKKFAAKAAKKAGASERAKKIAVAEALTPLEQKLAGTLKPLVAKLRKLPGKNLKDLAGNLGGTRMLPPTIFKTPGRFRKVMYDDPVDWPTVRANFNKAHRSGIDDEVYELHMLSPKVTPGKSQSTYDKAEERVRIMSSEPDDDSPKEPGSPGQLDKDAVKRWEKGKLQDYHDDTEFQVDHIGSLAQHWVESGHNTGEGARKLKAKKWSNLRLITRKWNSAKGSAEQGEDEGESARYHYNDKPHLGPNFQSGALVGDQIDGEDLITVDKS